MRKKAKETLRKQFWVIGVGVALLGAAFLIPNGASAVQDPSIYDCLDQDLRLCGENETCMGFFIFKQCTTDYFYMPRMEPT